MIHGWPPHHVEYEVRFDYTDTSHFNVTVSSSEQSTVDAILNKINLTLQDQLPITLNNTAPPLNVITVYLASNHSLTVKCYWDWNTHRNETITVSVYTAQNFTVPTKTVRTPPEVVWNITDVNFDLDHIEYFYVNVTNFSSSLQDVTVTKMLLNKTEVPIDPPSAVLTNDTQVAFNCSLAWGSLRGKNVTLTVVTSQSNISRSITVPSVELKLFGDKLNKTDMLGPYVNITLSNAVNSLQNVTINKIVFQKRNATFPIDGTITSPTIAPEGYILKIGETVTIVCRWNYFVYWYPPENLKVTVYTAEGIQVSKTFTT